MAGGEAVTNIGGSRYSVENVNIIKDHILKKEFLRCIYLKKKTCAKFFCRNGHISSCFAVATPFAMRLCSSLPQEVELISSSLGSGLVLMFFLSQV